MQHILTSLPIIFGCIVVLGAVYLLVKQYETRMILLGAGFLMAVVSLKPMMAFNAFSTNMVASTLIQNICSTLGFAAVLSLTQCDKHLIHALAKGLSYIRPLLIPGVAIATFIINIALPSAAGCAAAVGVLLIPLLISQGVAPVIAASAVMLGTFGSMLSPALMHNSNIQEIAVKAGENISVMDVILTHAPASIAAILIGAVSLAIIAKIRKEDKNFHAPEWANAQAEQIKVKPLLAILPMVPIIILLTLSIVSYLLDNKIAFQDSAWINEAFVKANKEAGTAAGWGRQLGVPHVMLIGAFLCLLFTKTSPVKATKDFFNGMGKGYGDVLGIIIAAGVFVAGMQTLGMVDAFIATLKEVHGGVVKIAATYGPFLLGVVSGSGDAAALAFNKSVTPHAAAFHLTIPEMGSMAALAGSLGRTMSPLAGAAIICAGIAKVNPMEMAKRNAPGMLIASVVSMTILLFL